jgi:hypothetical protein
MRDTSRFAVIDGVSRRVSDEARKTRVASFPGEHFSAEHEYGALHIYSHTDEHGNPAKKFGEPEGTSGIRSSAGSRLDGSIGEIGGGGAPRRRVARRNPVSPRGLGLLAGGGHLLRRDGR